MSIISVYDSIDIKQSCNLRSILSWGYGSSVEKADTRQLAISDILKPIIVLIYLCPPLKKRISHMLRTSSTKNKWTYLIPRPATINKTQISPKTYGTIFILVEGWCMNLKYIISLLDFSLGYIVDRYRIWIVQDDIACLISRNKPSLSIFFAKAFCILGQEPARHHILVKSKLGFFLR